MKPYARTHSSSDLAFPRDARYACALERPAPSIWRLLINLFRRSS